MRIVKVRENRTIDLGRQGEKEVTKVIFDVSSFIALFGQGVAKLEVVLPNGSEVYTAAIEQNENTVTWIAGPEWTERDGFGKCQLTWTMGKRIAKSGIYSTYVSPALR